MRKTLAWLTALLSPALLGAAPPAPLSIEARTLAGAALHLDGSHHDVVIVSFWASWCAPCRAEMPLLDAAYRRFHGKGLEMIGVSLDSGASRRRIAEASAGVTYPVARLADTDIRRHDLPRALPETRIYGRDGTLRHVFKAGKARLDAEALERILPPLLAER